MQKTGIIRHWKKLNPTRIRHFKINKMVYFRENLNSQGVSGQKSS
jgi:hypothetical protein